MSLQRIPFLVPPSMGSGYAETREMCAYPSLRDDLSVAIYPSMGPMEKLYDFSGRRNNSGSLTIGGVPSYIRVGDKWGFEFVSDTALITVGKIDDLVALENVTIVVGYYKTDATNRNSGVFGSSSSTSSKYCSGILPWSTGIAYWNFGSSISGAGRIDTTTHGSGNPTMGDDCWVLTSGNSRGMEMWQNGIRIAHHATANITRTADAAATLRLNRHSTYGGNPSVYKYFLVYNRVLSVEEIDLISRFPEAPLALKPSTVIYPAFSGIHNKSASHDLTLLDSVDREFIADRSRSHTLGLSSVALGTGDKLRSVTSSMVLVDSIATAFGLSNTMYLLQNVLYANLIGDRQVPENTLELTHSAHAFGSETLTDDLGITDSVSLLGPVAGDAAQPLGIFDHAHACIATPWAAIEVAHTLDLSHWVNIPYFESVSDVITFTDSGNNINTVYHSLGLIQSVVAGTGIVLTSVMALTDTLDPEIGYTRGAAHTTLLKDAFTYYIDSGCARGQYNRFEGCGEVAGIEEEPLTFDADFALESLTGTKDLLYLRSPETDDKQRIGYNRINRETRGGELNVYQDSTWPQTHSLLFTIVALSDGGCLPDKIGSLMDFFQNHLGEEIMIHDWEGLTWSGVVTTPNETAVEDRDGWWTISFEFEGVAIDGSQGDQQMAITDSVGLAADWVRSATDDVGLSDAAMASILGTIEESVVQDLGISDAVTGSHEHPTLEDDFSGGAGTDLHGQAPDVGTSVWSAHTNYKADGSQTGVNSGAYYPFAPASGKVYYIEWEARSLAENNGDETRFFLGEGLNSLPDDEGGYANGNTDPTTLKAGFVLREVAATQQNACRRGDVLDGQADTVNFTSTPLKIEADDIDLRLVLDTSLGAGHWATAWYAKDPLDSAWTEVRASAALLDEDITMLGWSNDNSTTTVDMDNISIIERATL